MIDKGIQIILIFEGFIVLLALIYLVVTVYDNYNNYV